ncbi:MAG: response regulator transcription factor [Solirubrobacteraceae bacterium]
MPGGLRLAAAGGVRSDGEFAGPPIRVAAQIRVVIADQHAGMRRALRLLLEPEDGVLVVAETGSLVTALHQLQRHRPDVLLLDPHLLDGSGINAVRWLRDQDPQTEIVVVTMDDCAPLAEHMLNAGAIGFVLKDTADAELAPAIRRAARGDRYTSPRMSLEPRSPEIGRPDAKPTPDSRHGHPSTAELNFRRPAHGRESAPSRPDTPSMARSVNGLKRL